jgi:UDP-2-acetamido-3-amino-2,3-dideoxy-glucuronate N-acetyltransferase
MSERAYFAHETACVDEPAEIGAGTHIWHFCHVMAGARLGRDVVLGQNVFVARGASLGDRTRVQNNVSVYAGVCLEEDVFLGPSCVFTNVTNPRAAVDRRAQFEPTRVRRGATIGANATVLPGVTVGQHAFVGAGAVVTKDVADYALVVGVPARAVGWVGRHGHPLVPEGDGFVCPASGLHYALTDDGLRCRELAEEAPLPGAGRP